MINKADYPILRAFLHRESRMYNWARTGERGRLAFVKKCFNAITKALPDEGFNYVRIASITNMGLLDSELKLSANPLNTQNGDVVFNLPPSPLGAPSPHRVVKE